MKQSMYGPKIQDELSSSSSPSPSSSWWWISLFLFYNNRPTRDCNLELQRLNRLCLRANFFWHGSQLCVLQEGVSNLACLQRYTMKLVFAFRPLLFDVEKGACFLVFEPPFSTSKTSFGFRLHFLYRLVGEHCVEKQKRFLVFGFRRPDWTDLTPHIYEKLPNTGPKARKTGACISQYSQYFRL